MARRDLLGLEPEDLVVLSNRGIVKRAQAEMDAGEPSPSIEEDEAGTVTVRWSDSVECVLPPGAVLTDCRCDCPATTLCRHLVRSVLAYQRWSAARAPDSGSAPAVGEAGALDSTGERELPGPTPREPWDPGAIPDSELDRLCRRTDLTRARRLFGEGQVLELVRSERPVAHVHSLACCLRFLVPGDLRYTHCDCAEAPPCSHVPLAVWAFRMLHAERAAGLVTTGREALAVPAAALDDVEAALRELARAGIAGAAQAVIDRLRRQEVRCRADSLVWPAEAIAELVLEWERYQAHDSRFSPPSVARLAGELCARMDAIRSDTGAVPQLFIRGSRTDRVTDVGKARLIGLGCGGEVRTGGVLLTAYLQDGDSGAVVSIPRFFGDPPADSPDPPRDLWRLAQTPVLRGTPLASLGAGQLIIRGGKRTPGGEFVLGRAQAAHNPQSFQWEALRAPVLVDGFAELQAHLAAQPPAALRPRRLGTDFHVCPVSAVEAVEWDPVQQAARAVLRDPRGEMGHAHIPFVSRAREGMDVALHTLRARPGDLRFIAGRARAGVAGPVIWPVGLVFEDGKRRTLLQPWVDRAGGESGASAVPAEPRAEACFDPVSEFPERMFEALGEQWLLGLEAPDAQMDRSWQDLRDRAAALGFHRLLRPIERLVQSLEQRRSTLAWDPGLALDSILELAVLAVLAEGVSAEHASANLPYAP